MRGMNESRVLELTITEQADPPGCYEFVLTNRGHAALRGLRIATDALLPAAAFEGGGPAAETPREASIEALEPGASARFSRTRPGPLERYRGPGSGTFTATARVGETAAAARPVDGVFFVRTREGEAFIRLEPPPAARGPSRYKPGAWGWLARWRVPVALGVGVAEFALTGGRHALVPVIVALALVIVLRQAGTTRRKP